MKSKHFAFIVDESHENQGYFTRVDIDMSPDNSFSNDSRSPHLPCQTETSTITKDGDLLPLTTEPDMISGDQSVMSEEKCLLKYTAKTEVSSVKIRNNILLGSIIYLQN